MGKIVPIASDHAGYQLKTKVIEHLKSLGFEVKDYGTSSDESVDYPDYAHPLASAVNKGEFERGVLICGSGNGVQMTANKYPNVRCALCWGEELAALARQHNDANVIALPARFIAEDEAMRCVDTFFSTPFEGGRHQRRVEKIKNVKI